MIGFPQGTGNRMIGIAFGQSRQFEQPLFRQDIRMYGRYVEGAFCQGTGFIKYHNLCLGQRFEIVAAFDQNRCV